MQKSLYGYVEFLALRWAEDPCDIALELAIREFKPRSSDLMEAETTLVFRGVRDLTLNFTAMRVICLVGIRDMRKDQLENIFYNVVESEHELFKFVCRDYEESFHFAER